MRHPLLGWFIIAFLIALLASVVNASAIKCPLCAGHEVQYCEVRIEPHVRLYGEEVTVTVSMVFQGEHTPVPESTPVDVMFYENSQNATKVRYWTDKNGVVKFMPKVVGYHLVKVSYYQKCDKSLLIYVNTTCGDEACGGIEDRDNCGGDCGDCGDGICDSDEDFNCSDCSVCGDNLCSAGESRNNCINDCAFCGDYICDYTEDRGSCADDCPSGGPDKYCDAERDGICDRDCGEGKDADCVQEVVETPVIVRDIEEKDESIYPILFLAIAVLVVAIIAASMVEVRKENKVKKAKVAKAAKKARVAAKKKEAPVLEVEPKEEVIEPQEESG